MSDLNEEFVAEAQEIVEMLSRDLLLLDQAQKDGREDVERVNDVFRGIHTLKGIAGMFGYPEVSAVSHSLEDLLDALRLGKLKLTAAVLDLLFEGAEALQRLLSSTEGTPPADVTDLIGRVAAFLVPQSEEMPGLERLALSTEVLSVLTEYEEHRLRTNVDAEIPIYRVQARFSLATLDTELEALRERAKAHVEIITYLPNADVLVDDGIELDVLIASDLELERVIEILALPGSTITLVEAQAQTKVSQRPAAASVRVAAPEEIEESIDEEVDAHEVPDASLRTLTNTVRVDIRKLDRLMNVVGELAIVRSTVASLIDRLRSGEPAASLSSELYRINRGFERRLDELQGGILDVRMVPLQQVFDRLARVVRQVSRDNDKQVRLAVTGADTEVDKLIVEELVDPMMHLVRNAIDHGIESPTQREISGKNKVGTLALNAYQKGNRVVLEIEDDGGGIRSERLIEVAQERGLIPPGSGQDMADSELHQLIFHPGLSTRTHVTDTSGRGVGMDVVRTNITRLGGVIDVQSEEGVGTKFTITLPVTLAIIRALLIRVAGQLFAIPITAVQEALLLRPEELSSVDGREVLTLRGSTLPLCRLANFFGYESKQERYIVVSKVGARRIGFVTDSLEEQRDIIIKPLGKTLNSVHGFAGATDLGDQRVALVLDASALLDELSVGSRQLAAGAG